MINFPLLKLRKKPRKYPIKRDEYGRSARRRAFDAFDQGLRPAEVVPLVNISLATACCYFIDWKKLPGNLEVRYRLIKAGRKSSREFSAETIKLIGAHLGMSEDEVLEHLQKPWGLKQLLMGKWPNYCQEREQSEAEVRLRVALNLINLLESGGVPPETILQQLLRMRTQFERP
jgi:hypothetical protein